MSVYLGEYGQIQLQRQNTGVYVHSELAPSDVNPQARRFSVDFAFGTFITGDLVEISSENSADDLVLVVGHNFPDWTGYVHVDEIGGIRLYETFSDALTGDRNKALLLRKASDKQNIKFQTQTDRFRCLAEVTGFDMTTSRESINTTSLCQEFQHQYEAGLISGQGRIGCFWQHRLDLCDDMYEGEADSVEFSIYLARLIIRLQQGAKFRGRFYLYRDEQNAASVWYECDCILTSCAVNVQPTQLLQTDIDFVTTGPIVLRQDSKRGYLLQEDESLILLESNQDGALINSDG